MFGFSMGRTGPEDHTISLFGKANRRGHVQSAPKLHGARVPSGYVDHLRSLPRTELVSRADTANILEGDVPPATMVSDLLLPAREFLVEMEPLAKDFVSLRIVHVRQITKGAQEKLLVTVISRVLDRPHWSITIPGIMMTLDECYADPALVQFAPEVGFKAFMHEMACAGFALAVVNNRQREMLGIVEN